MEINDVLINSVFVGVGLLFGKIFDFIKARWDISLESKKQDLAAEKQKAEQDLLFKKQQDDDEKADIQQALSMYRELAEGLKNDMKELQHTLHELEKNHLACREENAGYRAEIKLLTARVAQLEEQVKKST